MILDRCSGFCRASQISAAASVESDVITSRCWRTGTLASPGSAAVDDHVVERLLARHAQRHPDVALGMVSTSSSRSHARQAGGKVDRGRGLARATLLVENGDPACAPATVALAPSRAVLHSSEQNGRAGRGVAAIWNTKAGRNAWPHALHVFSMGLSKRHRRSRGKFRRYSGWRGGADCTSGAGGCRVPEDLVRALVDRLAGPGLRIAFRVRRSRLDPTVIAGLGRRLAAPVIGCSARGVIGPRPAGPEPAWSRSACTATGCASGSASPRICRARRSPQPRRRAPRRRRARHHRRRARARAPRRVTLVDAATTARRRSASARPPPRRGSGSSAAAPRRARGRRAELRVGQRRVMSDAG